LGFLSSLNFSPLNLGEEEEEFEGEKKGVEGAREKYPPL